VTCLIRLIVPLALPGLLAVGCTPSAKPIPEAQSPTSQTPNAVTSAPTAPITFTTATTIPMTVPATAPTTTGLRQVHTPGTLVIDETLTAGECHARVINAASGEVLPDPTCTPGAIDPAVTQANIDTTICTSGYTTTVRPPESVTDAFKTTALAPYGESYSSTTELDHLVPLELGGASSASNLWPEPNKTGATSVDNPKDSVEDAANHAVCDGQMTLAAAQQAIATNWITLGERLGAAGQTQPSPSPAPDAQIASCAVSASYDAKYNDYDIYVHSNQPDRTVNVTESGGATASWHTDVSGYADVYLHVTGNPAGQRVTATVGDASCSATL
jgi:hypothetical protein